MYTDTTEEYNIVEFEDERVNHFLHHFDECDMEHLYNFEFDCIETNTDFIEEIIWE